MAKTEKYLATFSGKFGDILWSLPTVRAIAEQIGEPIDFCIMPQYESLLPLLKLQPYIKKAYTLHTWECTGSPHGDQPWQAPLVDNVYEKVWHLTYRHHPAGNSPLIDFIAAQQQIKLSRPVPFINTEMRDTMKEPYIAYAFNDMYREQKESFFNALKERLPPRIRTIDISKLDWVQAAEILSTSLAYVGCRSSNYVLAVGVGIQVYVVEPHPHRSMFGPYGTTFSCPYSGEYEVKGNGDALYVSSKITDSLGELCDAT